MHLRGLPIMDTHLIRLRALPIINTRPTRLRVYVPLTSSIGALRAFVLCCFVLLQLKVKVCFVCTLQLTIHPPFSLLSLFFHIKLFYILFSFFCFKPSVTPLFKQLFCNNIYVAFLFLFHSNCLKASKVKNWKLWE